MFLVRVTRNDVPPPATGPFDASPLRGYQFRYAWDTSDAEELFTEWAWIVWRSADIAQRPYAPIAATNYISSIADNIVGVSRFSSNGTIIESESAYVFQPMHHAVDRVVAQRHGGSEAGGAGTTFNFDGQALIKWVSGLPLATFEYPQPLLYDTSLFLPPPVRFRFDLDEPPSTIHPTQSTEYQAPYFNPPQEVGDHPKIWRSHDTCDQIRAAATQYVGWLITFDAASKLVLFKHLDATSSDSLTLENIFKTRDRTRDDSHRICAWVATNSADGTRMYHGLNFRGETLVRATQIEQENGGFHFEEFVYSQDGLLRESHRPLGLEHRTLARLVLNTILHAHLTSSSGDLV
jgi:hypothetical protein